VKTKTLLALGAFLILVGPAHGQCSCSDEKGWSAQIALREETLRKVIATGNKDAIDAVANLILGNGLQPIMDTLGSQDPECVRMADALAEESKVETRMVEEYVESLRKRGAKTPGARSKQ